MCTTGLGRGTSTLEGLAIAQATMEHIHDNIGLIMIVSLYCAHLSVQAVELFSLLTFMN